MVFRLDCLAGGRADVNVPCGASMLPSLRIRGLRRGTDDEDAASELVGLCGPEVIWLSAAWDSDEDTGMGCEEIDSICFCLWTGKYDV